MLQTVPSDSEAEQQSFEMQDEILDESDLMHTSDDNNSNSSSGNGGGNGAHESLAPPPRIAARFYRPTPTRRKSSAASSRRNSISSQQSQSGRAFRAAAGGGSGGCQSNHIAQHLRRASILESRKARLADRAAHAEQVRLRAAQAKAALRVSHSEEKALAAQKAREAHLAQVAAACAEEVRRAKKVAEDMRERKAAEERRYRVEMQEKLAEAERRRLEYQRNARRPRTASVPSSEPKKAVPVVKTPLSEAEAAKRIQVAWRTRRRRRIVEAFLDLGLSIDKVHDTSFEEITDMLAEEKVQKATANILHLFGLEGSEGSIIDDKAAVRTFLSAYLILGHPASVLSKDGDQERDLIQKAKELVLCFESTLSKLSPSNRYQPDPTQLETLLLAHGAFVSAFTDWKAQDSSALIDTMVATFVNLDAIWQSVKDDSDGEVAQDYKEGIRDNQVILLSKIRKLAGPERANMLIKKAIRESRRSRLRRKPVGDVRPRPAVESPPSESSEPETADSAHAASKIAAAPSAAASGDDQVNALMRLFSPVPPNRVLVHELAIDREFRIDASPHSDLRDAINREVCEAMRRGFAQGEGDKWTVAMAQNIRGKLLHLLKPGNSMYTLIADTLDPEHVAIECARNAFSYEKFFEFMASILPKLCAPFRDEQVKTLCEELRRGGTMDEMIDTLFKLLHVIDLLSLDYSNFLLMSAAPTLIKEATGYEQREFAKDLEQGRITLQRTQRWWRNASVNVLTEADRRDPAHRPPTSQKIYARGLVDLAIATTPLQEDEVPETLALDRARLARIRADVLRIVTVGSILLTAKSLLKRDVRSPWKAEAARLWELLLKQQQQQQQHRPAGEGEDNSGSSSSSNSSSVTLTTKTLSILESAHAMPAATRAQLASTISRLLNPAQTGSGRLTDPVMKVLFQRLKGHVHVQLAAASSAERVRAASAASAGLAASGIPEFVGHVGELVRLLQRVAEVDRRAHAVWYEGVAGVVEGMGDGVGDGEGRERGVGEVRGEGREGEGV